jgi:two-component system, NarL family, sensor histidine kinase DesK
MYVCTERGACGVRETPEVSRRLPLLPPNSRLGWTPYAWLIYLPTFLIEPVLRTQAGRASALYWAVTILAIVVFLVSYFVGYWVDGRRRMAIVAVQAALGVMFAPINTGSGVFFVYAASFAGFVVPRRTAVRLVAGIAALGAIAAWATSAPIYFWIVAIAFSLLVGGVNVHTAEQHRNDSRLRLAHQQIEHLAAMAERERIARDLHDVLGHTLSMIVLKAELAGRLVERDPARARSEIADVESVARRTLQEVREAIRGYRPTLADELARATALLATGGVQAHVDVLPVRLSPESEHVLALAVREAVTNVVRHAEAKQCTLRIRQAGDDIALEISDNGRGSNVAEGGGLSGMRERVDACGGTVSIRSDHGLQLLVTVPAAGRAGGAGAGA